MPRSSPKMLMNVTFITKPQGMRAGGHGSADPQGQRARPADLAGRPGHRRRVGEGEVADPRQPDLQGDPEFHARQVRAHAAVDAQAERGVDRKSTRLNSSHVEISYAVFC